MKQLLASGATFIARTHAMQVAHMMQTFERAINHDGFSVVECLSECVMFYPGAFDDSLPRKGGAWDLIDETQHDVTDDVAAFQLADQPAPGSSVCSTRRSSRPRTRRNSTGSPTRRPSSAVPPTRT